MGCCFSSDHTPHFPTSPSSDNNAALEESVKEVLPETATPPPPVRSESPFIKVAPLLDFSTPFHHNGAAVYGNPFPPYGDDIDSSLSEGVTEKRRSGELRRRSPARSRNPSFSGEFKREKPAGRSPGRISDPSPNRVNGRKRDSEESSGRRSRSPGIRAGPGQGRKTGRSPGRVGSGLGDRTRKLDVEKWAPTSNELLENPLVSLECFIFL